MRWRWSGGKLRHPMRRGKNKGKKKVLKTLSKRENLRVGKDTIFCVKKTEKGRNLNVKYRGVRNDKRSIHCGKKKTARQKIVQHPREKIKWGPVGKDRRGFADMTGANGKYSPT